MFFLFLKVLKLDFYPTLLIYFYKDLNTNLYECRILLRLSKCVFNTWIECVNLCFSFTEANSIASAEGITGGSVSFDSMLNLISGRTTMLKKVIKIEKKELFIPQIESMFDESHFVEKLKIPSDYVKGFECFAVENEKFTIVLKTNNKTSV